MSVLVCPVCQSSMREINRNGVLIDTCTQCRGVWLDRGELEKLATVIGAPSARARSGFLPAAAPASQPLDNRRDAFRHNNNRYDRDDDDDDDDDDRHKRDRGPIQQGAPKRTKVSRFLDFFD